MRIALYKGTSLISRLIRFVTRSQYSHAAFLLDSGAVVEAWQGGVKYSPSISTLHKKHTHVDIFDFKEPLTDKENFLLSNTAFSYVGRPYDFIAVLRFVTKRRCRKNNAVFCSELVCECCERIGRPLYKCPSWQVPPAWLAINPLLKKLKTVYTTAHE